jgi:hypothetical protein
MIAALVLPGLAAGPDMADGAPAVPVASKKHGDTPALVGDSCFGGKDEKEADLLTGNEELVQQLLQQMLSPGS